MALLAELPEENACATAGVNEPATRAVAMATVRNFLDIQNPFNLETGKQSALSQLILSLVDLLTFLTLTVSKGAPLNKKPTVQKT